MVILLETLHIPRMSDWDPSEVRESVRPRSQNLGDLIRSLPLISECPSSWLLGVLKYLSEDGIPDLKLSLSYFGVIMPRYLLLLGLHSDSRDFSPLLDNISLRGQE